MTNKTLNGLILAACVLYGIAAGPVHALPTPPKPVTVQKPAPAPKLAFADAAGSRHALDEYRGKYVLINLWATWCAPCVAELPTLAKLKAAVPGLTVLTINMDKGKVDAGAFLKSHNAGTLPPMRDSEVMMMRTLKVYAMPTTVLVDPKGQIIARAEGPAEWASPDSIAYFKAVTAK